MDLFYHLAHRALRNPLLRETGLFEGLLADEYKAAAWLDTAAEETARLCGLEPEQAKALSRYCLVYKSRIAGHPALIVQMPPPQAASHCYFVAALRGADGEIHYYTLERSFSDDQAALCGWSDDGAHSLYEFIPAGQDAATFAAAIDKIEQRRTPQKIHLPPLA